MPELNSLRGLACLAVLLFHGLWWYVPTNAVGVEGFLRDWSSAGFRGVNLFFVLSGLLITGILLDSRERADYFPRFYKRRALRILPAYYLTIVLLAACGLPRAFLGLSVIYVSNITPRVGVAIAYGPFWSLAVEEQFYLVWPLLVRKLNKATIATVAAFVFAGSIALMIHLNPKTVADTFPIWYSGHGLALGALLAIFLRSKLGSRKNALRFGVLLGAGCFGVLYAQTLAGSFAVAYSLREAAWDLAFAVTLLFALLLGSSPFEAFARPRWLQFFGEISYGLYLVHVLVFMLYRRIFHPANTLGPLLLQFAVCATVSVALATLSRFTVEEWFLSLKDKRLKFGRTVRYSLPSPNLPI